MGQYIIEVLCFQTVFFAVYLLLFRRETFFQYNRLYLLCAPLVSMALPFISIGAFQTTLPISEFQSLLPEVFIGTQPENLESVIEEPGAFTFNWFFIYAVGAAAALLFFGNKLRKLTHFFRYRTGTEKIIQIPESSEAFTFLNHIFIGADIDSLSRKRILAHEHIHVKQRHTWDLLYFEILRVVFWFNPLIYLYQKETTIVHEYLADAAAIRSTSREEYFTALLNTTFGTQRLSFINTFFNHSFIKNRIVMLQKSKSNKTAIVKYALIIPMLVGMLFYVSCSEDSNVPIENETLEAKIASLKLEMEDKETITAEEYQNILDLVASSRNKRLNQSSSNDEIIEVVEVQEVGEMDPNLDIPFAGIENVPVFPGCEASGDNTAKKKCMSDSISQLVNSNFNTKLGADLGLTGINRIFIQFKIDKNGNIADIKSRAAHPELQTEAERVIKLLPQMKPGIQRGKPVGVLYSLPIAFKI